MGMNYVAIELAHVLEAQQLLSEYQDFLVLLEEEEEENAKAKEAQICRLDLIINLLEDKLDKVTKQEE